MCTCTYGCMCVCLCWLGLSMCAYGCIYLSVCVCVLTHVYTCVCMCVNVCECVCVLCGRICIYESICVYMNLYICVYLLLCVCENIPGRGNSTCKKSCCIWRSLHGLVSFYSWPIRIFFFLAWLGAHGACCLPLSLRLPNILCSLFSLLSHTLSDDFFNGCLIFHGVHK